ncbi:metallophosphoesterase [Neomegalonema sp.]|uniref:metallophosphoesterase n=1 Tax=Neomegalonema sp. TaxID=2039713 RepID=UPI00262A37F5|nr:metallophosphoesterase [Neomegalonema sp.]MDD2869040.1 metallophosphoesterase [Neomegalonema sp.]
MLEVNQAEIRIEGLKAPIRALVVADTQSLSLHWSERRLAERLKPMVEAQKPDLILLLGDYAGISHGPAQKLYNDWMRVDPEAAARILGGLQAPLGVYAILGNHDWAENGEAMAAALAEGGARVLRNESLEIALPGGGRLVLAGVDDPVGPEGARPDLALAGTDPAAPLIFLTHRPDEAVRLPRPASLSVAGHTHGGQICLPMIGCPITMSRHGFVAGLYETAQGPLYVSRGIGTAALPLRFLNPPEIVALTLVPASPPGAPAPPAPTTPAPRPDSPELIAREEPKLPNLPFAATRVPEAMAR